MAAADGTSFRLFVYGTLLEGESDHGLLAGAKASGAATTRPLYKLVELNAMAGLLDRGDTAVVGEIYEVDAPTLARCDVRREHPVLYERRRIELEDGSAAWTYFLRHEQARGLRRIRGGDWRKRFATTPSATREASAFARWARSRYKP